MTTMRSWTRKWLVSTTMGGALAAAFVFGAATEASAQNWGNYGYFQGHQGQNYASRYDSSYFRGSDSGVYRYGRARYPVPSGYNDRMSDLEYYRWALARELRARGYHDTAPRHTSGHLYY